jgi:hypothetical protein
MKNSTIEQDGLVTFFPEWSALGPIAGDYSEHLSGVKNEPMLFNSDADFAFENGGPITRAFVQSLRSYGFDERMESCVIDSRVHMLMRGWYPCIPGWHIDDFHRPDGNQPDYLHLPENMAHVCCIVGDCSRTEFLDRSVRLTKPEEGEKVYGSFNKQIRAAIENGAVRSTPIDAGRLVRFGGSDFHRGVAATHSGWRWFARATFGSTRVPSNEIRRQVQVYLPELEAGW